MAESSKGRMIRVSDSKCGKKRHCESGTFSVRKSKGEQYGIIAGELFIKAGADLTCEEEEGGHEWDFWDRQIKKVLDWLPLDEDDSGLGSGNVKAAE